MNDLLKTGIYIITNTDNLKFYIGSARLNFKSRFGTHKSNLKHNNHCNIHLQRAYNLYGKSVFKFEILEFCEGDEYILEREQFYIDMLSPSYNIVTNVKQPTLGIPMSEEHKEKLRITRLGVPSWNKGTGKEVLREDGKIYKNVHEAAKDIGVSYKSISKIINDIIRGKVNRKIAGHRFTWLEIGSFPKTKNKNHKNVYNHTGGKFQVKFGTKHYGTFKTYKEAELKAAEIRQSLQKRKKD